jgi:hypothetical protein
MWKWRRVDGLEVCRVRENRHRTGRETLMIESWTVPPPPPSLGTIAYTPL